MSCMSPYKMLRPPRPPHPERRRSALVVAALACVLAGCATRSARDDQAAPLVIEVPDVDLDAEVFVDGNYVGQVKALRVPETGPILLAPGVHRVEVRKPGRFPVQRTVTVGKSQRTPAVVRAELLEDPA